MSIPLAGDPSVRVIVQRALEEDVGTGDASSRAVIDADETCVGHLLSRGDYVLAGTTVAELVFQSVDKRIAVRILAEDGARVKPDDVVMEIEGPARGILTAERNALNFLQRMSGIATTTRTYVDRVRGHRAVILDTRKTTPLHRVLDKYAVTCGGGRNHRMGLYDFMILKDNHLAQWRKKNEGDLADMVRYARAAYPNLPLEVEVESVADCERVLSARPDWILLDNMSPDDMRRCVALAAGRCKLEASGGITLDNVDGVASTGVDAISVGALTHSSRWADFSLELNGERVKS
jgi:nicotinate-nucleotide pyrophosphorylase (carboxylating)